MKLTRNFSKIEFESRDGAPMPNAVLQNLQVLATNLQVVRDYLGAPIHVNSGYRSKRHNYAVGGSSTSQHILGKAADITMKHYTAKELVVVFERMMQQGKILPGGLGLYNGFVHYDIRGIRRRWNRSSRYQNFW